MARRKAKIDSGMENQISLFDQIEEINPWKFSAPDYQVETKPLQGRIREAMNEAMKNSGLKRYEVAGRMSEHLGIEITDSMLNAYTAESKEGHRMPAEFIPAFCLQTKDYKLLEILVAAAGCRMVKSDEIYLLELGRVQQAQKTLQQKERQLQKEWERLRKTR